jgi:hypothetical protein
MLDLEQVDQRVRQERRRHRAAGVDPQEQIRGTGREFDGLRPAGPTQLQR